MKTLHFSTTINTDPQLVWQVMLEPPTYTLWTAEFAEGSYYEGVMTAGEKILFLAPGGGGGMIAMVAACRPAEFISFKHIGMIKDGVEDTESAAVRSWAPAFENYTFVRVGDATEVKVEIDVAPDWEDYMQNTWPKALARLKTLCETR